MASLMCAGEKNLLQLFFQQKLTSGDFDCDDTVQPGVAAFPYLTHTTLADLSDQLIGS